MKKETKYSIGMIGIGIFAMFIILFFGSCSVIQSGSKYPDFDQDVDTATIYYGVGKTYVLDSVIIKNDLP